MSGLARMWTEVFSMSEFIYNSKYCSFRFDPCCRSLYYSFKKLRRKNCLSSVVNECGGFYSSYSKNYFKSKQIYPNRGSSVHVQCWTSSIWKVPFSFPNVEEGNFFPCFWQNFLFSSILPETVRWNAKRSTQLWIHWQSRLSLHQEHS